MSKVYLSLGSNLQHKKKNIELAINYLSCESKITVLKKSSIWETEPVGNIPQDNFYNCAVLIETTLSPYELLDTIHNIEYKLKRKREIRWGPRTIDIDIILFDNIKINDKLLVIPHKEMKSRLFVLLPLKEIILPNTDIYKYINELINKCDKSKFVRKVHNAE